MRGKTLLASLALFLSLAAIPVNAQVGGGFFLNQGGGSSGALAIDGTPVTQGTGQTGDFALTYSTSNPGDVIYIAIRNSAAPGTAALVSSITDTAGLTWTSRRGVNLTGTNGLTTELWSAYAPGALTSDVITVHQGTGIKFMKAVVFAVSGVNSGTHYDSNGTIPGAASSLSSTTSLTTTISTTNANDLLVAVFNCSVTGNCGTITPPSGFTNIGGVGTQFDVSYKIVSSTQSSVAEQYTFSAGSGVFMYAMVIDAAAK